MDVEGDDAERLTSGGDNKYASWSPDGTRIAFNSDRDGDDEVYLMDIDGSNLVQLTDNEVADSYPVWSPDGTVIAFNSDRKGDWNIYLMDINGENVVQITSADSAELYPTWLPECYLDK